MPLHAARIARLKVSLSSRLLPLVGAASGMAASAPSVGAGSSGAALPLHPGSKVLVLEGQELLNLLTAERKPLKEGPWRLAFTEEGQGVLELDFPDASDCVWAQHHLQFAVLCNGEDLVVAEHRGKPEQTLTPLRAFQSQHVLQVATVGRASFDMAEFPHSVDGARYWWRATARSSCNSIAAPQHSRYLQQLSSSSQTPSCRVS